MQTCNTTFGWSASVLPTTYNSSWKTTIDISILQKLIPDEVSVNRSEEFIHESITDDTTAVSEQIFWVVCRGVVNKRGRGGSVVLLVSCVNFCSIVVDCLDRSKCAFGLLTQRPILTFFSSLTADHPNPQTIQKNNQWPMIAPP